MFLQKITELLDTCICSEELAPSYNVPKKSICALKLINNYICVYGNILLLKAHPVKVMYRKEQAIVAIIHVCYVIIMRSC